MKTCEEIRNDWKEIRPKLGNLISVMDAKIDETGKYESAYKRGYEVGAQNPTSLGFEHGYEAGINAAWETALKIFELSASDFTNVFDAPSYLAVFSKYSASEAIQKLKEYDYQKACEEAKAVRKKIIIEELKDLYRKYGPDEVFAAQKEIDLVGR